MEKLRENLPMIVAVIIAILILVLGYYFTFVHEEVYYTKIDNEKIEQISNSDDMKYQYILIAYDSNGKKKKLFLKQVEN